MRALSTSTVGVGDGAGAGAVAGDGGVGVGLGAGDGAREVVGHVGLVAVLHSVFDQLWDEQVLELQATLSHEQACEFNGSPFATDKPLIVGTEAEWLDVNPSLDELHAGITDLQETPDGQHPR